MLCYVLMKRVEEMKRGENRKKKSLRKGGGFRLDRERVCVRQGSTLLGQGEGWTKRRSE